MVHRRHAHFRRGRVFNKSISTAFAASAGRAQSGARNFLIMEPKLYDTHAHVNFNAFKEDSATVIKRSIDAAVWLNLVGSQSTTSNRALTLARQFTEGVFAIVGLHPNHVTRQVIDEEESRFVSKGEKFDYKYYYELANDKKVVGIGECGLDYFHLPTEMPFTEVREKQITVFKEQCRLATEVKKPLIVHCREAQNDILDILEYQVTEGNLPARGVAHCFDGTPEDAKRYLAIGFYLSFAGIITFPPRKTNPEHTLELQSVVKDTPLNRILIETDSPYLAPIPHRGKRNEPLYVEFVAQKIAELKDLLFEEVARATTENARKLFKV